MNPGPAEAELCGGGSPRRVGAGPCAAAQPTPALRGPTTRAWTPGRRACPGSCWPLRVAVSAFPGRQCHVAVLGGGVHAPRALLWAGGFRLRRQPRRPALPSHVVPFEALGDARVLCGPRRAQGEGSAGVFTTHSWPAHSGGGGPAVLGQPPHGGSRESPFSAGPSSIGGRRGSCVLETRVWVFGQVATLSCPGPLVSLAARWS